MEKEIILSNKDGFVFTKVKKNHYKLNFDLENKNIDISKIIDFNLIKLIYDLNSDVYEKVNMEKINDNEVVATLLMKHFFEDIGLPQRFSFLHIQKIIEQNRILFRSQSITTHRPEGMPEDSELMNMENMTSVCNILTLHKASFSFNIIFNQSMFIPPFAEKIITLILNKMFKRVKQFIENIRM